MRRMDAPLPPRGFHRLVTSLSGFLLPNLGPQNLQFLRCLPLPLCYRRSYPQ